MRKAIPFVSFLSLCALICCCAQKEYAFGRGKQAEPCRRGALGCACNESQRCDVGLLCLADRCLSGKADGSGAASGLVSTSEVSSMPPEDPKETSTAKGGSIATSQSSSSGLGSDTQSDSAPRCDDALPNGAESDVDCGGADCPPCGLDQRCRQDRDCRSLYCHEGRCVPPVRTCATDEDCDDQEPCTQEHCNAQRRCEYQRKAERSRCDDADPCTANDKCHAGYCKGRDSRVLVEDFSAPPFRFLNTDPAEFREWEIGVAKASHCQAHGLAEDPAQDHTQNGANGVMGVKIGGCQEVIAPEMTDCAWSDEVDVSHFDQDIIFSYWRHLSTPGSDLTAHSIPRVYNYIYYRVPGDPVPYLIESGWKGASVDGTWTRFEHPLSTFGLQKVAFGICFRRQGAEGVFPGWSVDDVWIRQRGCEMKR